ncbi:hypothetical protein BYT27DRAFT_7081830 [Phlegmacium glaucopus]|nr:hypothetical protein BYT27DRAFT_7081830 [Phlegmacium glaucopus]
MESDVAGSIYSPFWKDFPLCDIHRAITPDVLHQLYQGIFKHIISWCQLILKPAELDRRIRALPIGYGLRKFKNGISALSQISGSERKNMAKILLGCLVGKIPRIGLQAIKAALDFIYLAQYTTHDTVTLGYLQDALNDFHKHKIYFINAGVRDNLNIPKFHSLLHYIEAIELFGTTDNYNTEMFERLHIDFAKNGWRASNQRDEFPQMIRWLSRQEKVDIFDNILTTREYSMPLKSTKETILLTKRPPISIAKTPNHPKKLIATIESNHKAPGLSRYLKEFLNSFLSSPTSMRRASQFSLPFRHLDVFNMFKFHPEALQDDSEENDLVKAIPISKRLPNGRFDTVVVLNSSAAESTGLTGRLTTFLKLFQRLI